MQSQISMSILGVCATQKNIDPKWREFPKLLIDSGLNLVACESQMQNHHFDLEAYPHTLKFFGKSLDTKHFPISTIRRKQIWKYNSYKSM